MKIKSKLLGSILFVFILFGITYGIDFVTYTNSSCQQINGSSIISTDGTYLGILSNNRFDSDSIANRFGDYGNRFSNESIFNRFGDYGNRFSNESPWNRFSNNGPLLIKGQNVIGTLTTNKFANGSIDSLGAILCFIDITDERLEPFIELYNIEGSSNGPYLGGINGPITCGTNSYSNGDGNCICNQGYVRLNSDPNNYDCRAKTEIEICEEDFGNNATAGTEKGKCMCKTGYQWSTDRTYCELIPTPIVTKTPTELCQDSFGINSYSDGSAHTNGGYNCYCKEGYKRNTDNTSCEKIMEQENTTNTTNMYTDILRKDLVAISVKEAISFLYDNGLTSFNSMEQFLPNNSLRRDEAAAFFARFTRDVLLKEVDESVISCNVFNDLEKAHQTLIKEIQDSCKLGLLKGHDKSFMPTEHFSNAQAITVLIRLLEGDKDEPAENWAINYYNTAKSMGIISGLTAEDITNLYEPINRGDVAKMIEAANFYLENK